jgi:formylglycine-generating enzyme required for sulfatase activity
VDRFPANAFGLYDVLGNAGQWTADCYVQSYDGAPGNGAPWMKGDCTLRVSRGGAWLANSKNIRFARRTPSSLVGRFNANGFRVARSL